MHVPEDEVSLSFHSQLIGQMKHQHSTGRVKHSLNVSGMVTTHNCPAKGRKISRENLQDVFQDKKPSQDKNGCDTFLLFFVHCV